jgi:hypothetical protein
VRVEVTVDQSPARDRTLFLVAHLPQQGTTIPHAIYVAKAKVPAALGVYPTPVKLGASSRSSVPISTPPRSSTSTRPGSSTHP